MASNTEGLHKIKNQEADGEEILEEKKNQNVDHLKIDTAVKFLQNPKVAASPLSRRIGFLRDKGLTETEIQLAVERSGATEFTGTTQMTQDHNEGDKIIGRRDQPVTTAQASTGGTRWKDLFGAAVIGAGFLYSMGYLVKAHVIPSIFGKQGKPDEEEQMQFKLTLQELRGGFGDIAVEMRDTFRSIQQYLDEQQRVLGSLRSEVSVCKSKLEGIPSDMASLSEIKNELSSLKGLALGRRQFPPSPFAASSTSPSIPAWQKATPVSRGESKVSSSRQDSPASYIASSEDIGTWKAPDYALASENERTCPGNEHVDSSTKDSDVNGLPSTQSNNMDHPFDDDGGVVVVSSDVSSTSEGTAFVQESPGNGDAEDADANVMVSSNISDTYVRVSKDQEEPLES